MENKIITLPVSGGAGEVPTINRFQMDMENLLDTAADTLQDDLFTDTLEDDVSAEDWERYTRIVRGIFVARDAGWDLESVKYQYQPLSGQGNCASVTITIYNNRPFPDTARVALVMAALLSDGMSTTTEKNKAKICFTVNNIFVWD